ncbi:MAG: dihydroneopterin aldolase [Alphaproteobacteria bacterium]|nr:dihydroneopterin aldolase [Alphaproteobacteria bacterium]
MSADKIPSTMPARIANAGKALRHVFIRDFMVECLIGVYEHEKCSPQRVRINLDLAVDEGEHPIIDDILNVVSYETMANGILAIADEGHVNLVETLAERIAGMCFDDQRVDSVRVRIEKLDILENAGSVGVEIERFRKV